MDVRRWDASAAALIKMVAGKLHSEEQQLSPHWDNDHMLGELHAYDWDSGSDEAPAHLHQLVRKVIEEVERNAEIYAGAFPCLDDGEQIGQPVHGLASARMLYGMVGNVIHKVTANLIIKAIPLLPELKEGVEDLRSICDGNYSMQRRLEELGVVLERLSRNLALWKGEHQQTFLRVNSYLNAISSWLKSVAAQWMSLEYALLEQKDNPSVLGTVVGLMEITERLLSDTQLKPVLDSAGLDGFVNGLGTMKQVLSQVHLWQAMPGEAGVEDYLGVLACNPLVANMLDQSTLRLGHALAQALNTAPYPADATLTQRIGWLAAILGNRDLYEHTRPHLEMLLGGREQTEQIFAVFQFIERLIDCPADSTLCGQALTLLNALGQAGTGSGVLAWTRHFQEAMAAGAEVANLLNRLLTTRLTPASWPSVMRELGIAAAPGIGQWAIGHIAHQLLPVNMAQKLENFYRESYAAESWSNFCQRMAVSAWEIARPQLMNGVMGDPLAAATVQYAMALKTHGSWEQTLQWFVARDQSEDQTLQFIYSQYLNAMLVWQLYQAFNSSAPQETEDALITLARQLKDYQVVKSYPQLEKLIDLIPLLPALSEARHLIGAQTPVDSWLAWSNQWLNALANSKNKRLQDVCDRLSRRVESWLADAMMSACDVLVRQPWELLPGTAAGAVTVPDISERVRPTDGTRWQLATGISLEAIGLAGIGYALWKTRQRSLQSVEVKAAMWEQKVPLLIGFAGMATGGVLLYQWMAEDGQGQFPSAKKDSAIAQARDIIDQLEVDGLHFIFDQPLIFVAQTDEWNASKLRVAKSLQDEAATETDLQSEIDSVLHKLDMGRAIRTEFNTLFQKAAQSGDVMEAPPGKERDVRRLLKTIALTSALMDEIKSKPWMNEFHEFGQAILKDLSALADTVNDDAGKSIVERFRQTFARKSPSSTAAPNAPQTSGAILKQGFPRLGRRSMERVERLYKPILNPASFIDDYIRKGIRNFETSHGTQTHLRPDSKIQVHYYPIVLYHPNLQGPRAPVPVSRYFSLTEIVTGQYLYETTRLRDVLGRRYRITSMDHQELIQSLTNENLQSVMEQELAAYRNHPGNAADMQTFYQGMINIRCLEYLSRRHPTPLYAKAVRAFLKGKVQAETVSFHNVILNGVFFIPAGPAGGVLFSVDEARYFHFGSCQSRYWDGGWRTETLAVFPQTQEFKDWVCHKIPTYHAEELKNDENAFKYKTSNFNPPWGPARWNKVVERPFSSTPSQGRKDLAGRLFDGLMKRLESDIDTIVFSYPEQITEKALEMAKQILSISSIVLGIAIPGTGSVLARFSVFMASLVMEAAWMGASAIQSHLSDRPDRAKEFRDDIIVAGVLSGLGVMVSGALMVRAAYSVKNVNQAITLYRNARSMLRQAVPEMLSEMNWTRLANRRKVVLLARTTMQDAPQVRSLARLTNRKIVRQSIRNNLLLDFEGAKKLRFAWNSFTFEQAQVLRRLNSDLTRLTEVNQHMRQLLNDAQTISKHVVPGSPKQAAVRWIAGHDLSRMPLAEARELTEPYRRALEQFRHVDLLDVDNIARIHDAVYKPPPGEVTRTFRSSSDPVFMGSDIGRAGFEKALARIEASSVVGQVDLGVALYEAVRCYHPFGDGNGRTARTVYALATLRKGEQAFTAVSKPIRSRCPPIGTRMRYRNRTVQVAGELPGQRVAIKAVDGSGQTFRRDVKWDELEDLIG